MEASGTKRRDPCTSPVEHRGKKIKGKDETISFSTFSEVIASLSTVQKSIVKEIGFKSLLHYNCNVLPNELLHWLIGNFDCSTRSLHLPNGSTCELNSHTIYQILGIPNGLIPVPLIVSKQHFSMINEDIRSRGKKPTISHLLGLIKSDLAGCSFARVFMLLALSLFLCPKKEYSVSKQYYAALVDVQSIHLYDWSSLVTDWLVACISKQQKQLLKNKDSNIGGCCIILVICYLEFLNISKHKLPSEVPRIRVWNSEIIQTFISIDESSGDRKFGNIPIKDIRATPFHNNFSQIPLKYKVPEDVQKFLQLKYGAQGNHSAMSQFHSMSECLYRSMVTSLLPVISNYVDNMARILCQRNNHVLNFDDSDSDSEDCLQNISPHELNKYLNEFQFMEVPKIQEEIFSIDHLVEQLTNSFSGMDNTLDLLDKSEDCDKLMSQLMPQPIRQFPILAPEANSTIEDFLYLEDLSDQAKKARKEKSKEERVDTQFLPKLKHNSSSVERVQVSNKRPSFSTNELFHSSKRAPEIGPGPSFDMLHAFESTNASTDLPGFSEIWKGNSNQSGNKYSANTWNETMENHCIKLEHDSNVAELEGFRKSFIRTSELINQVKITPAHERIQSKNPFRISKQCVHPTKLEEDFFNFISDNILKCSVHPRIFQLNQTWVDQRTLWFSMKFGGWISNYVMEAFCKMFLHEQQSRLLRQEFVPGQFLTYIVDTRLASLMMNATMTYSSDVDAFNEGNIGFKLDDADLVYVPCVIQKNQWFLIVANFKEKSFDLLTPDYGIDKYLPIFSSVINNFRIIFLKAYPTARFNIRNFSTKVVQVPKQNFSYDSGVFVLRFIQTYNGTNVQNFSNVDINALRQKLLYKLVTYEHNIIKNPLVMNFLQMSSNIIEE